MYLPSKNIWHQTGISIIDLLVGVAISLFAMLLILELSAVFESRRATSTDISETQINAVNVMTMLERDVRLSGYGLGPVNVWGCRVKRHYVTIKNDLILLPIEIIDGANGGPDSLRIMASSKKENSASYVLINPYLPNSTNMVINSNLGINTNDILILYEADKQCTMFQVTRVDNDGYRIANDGARSPWNPDSPTTLFPSDGYAIGANIINTGTLFERKYLINNQNELAVENYLSSSDSKTTFSVASNIINFQAQYGFDTRNGTQTSAKVTKWSAVMLDADSNEIVGDNGDLQRILAIRFAIVARSAKQEITTSGNCNTSSSPSWRAGNPVTGELEDVEIDVSKNPDQSINQDWRCFRYRVYESIVPLRNVMWGQS